jgi:RHS repeat-associated protein
VGSAPAPANVMYIHDDHLGTPQKMTDAAKAITWDRVQDPFGNTHSLSGASQNPLRFPGQYADEESALSYNYFRDYDPTLGRYVQSDPIGLEGGLNTFAYVGGNPISNADPKGLKCVKSGEWLYCAYPDSDGPAFVLPAPEGYPNVIDPDYSLIQWLKYHMYDVSESIGCLNPDAVRQALINNPTPGNPMPATPNNAPALVFRNNPVTSYLTTDLRSGDQIVVNLTGPDSAFSPGYVARTVKNGYAHTYGEGLNWKQSFFGTGMYLDDIVNWLVWDQQMQRLIEELMEQGGCGCPE